MEYLYRVDVETDEAFLATVCDEQFNTVYEVKAGGVLQVEERSLIQSGFMDSYYDMEGLQSYLAATGVIGRRDCIVQVMLH